MALDSRFVYPRSMSRDIAATLCDLRSAIPDPVSLDMVIRALADTFSEHDPRFDVDDFVDRCVIGRR